MNGASTFNIFSCIMHANPFWPDAAKPWLLHRGLAVSAVLPREFVDHDYKSLILLVCLISPCTEIILQPLLRVRLVE